VLYVGYLAVVIMSITARALYPSEATILGWNTMEDLRGWAGVTLEEWKVIAMAVGDQELDNILLVAGMPPHLLTGVLNTWIEAGPRHSGSFAWQCCSTQRA
jgi:hypothetical protein